MPENAFRLSMFTMHFVVLVLTSIMLLLNQKRRKYFPIWFAISLGAGIAVTWFFPNFDFWSGSYMGYAVSFAMTLVVLFCTFNISIKQTIFYGATAWAIQNCVNHMETIVKALVKYNLGLWEIMIGGIASVIAAGILFYFFVRKINKDEEFFIDNLKLILTSAIILIITFVLSNIIQMYRTELAITIATRVFSIICCVFALMVQFGFFQRSKLQKQNEIIEQMLYMEREQHRISKENIELINLKCHDLKHQIAALRGIDNKAEQEKYLCEIEKSVIIYDSAAKTGNEALDIVLTEKSLLCEKYNIKFTYMADGERLNFMDSVDVYTLFGNTIDNAIESVSKIESDERRIISLMLYAKDKILNIHIENYYEHDIKFENGLPITTKEDKKYHGFGMRSIQLVVEKYDGEMSVAAENNLFSFDMIIPIK